MFKYVLAGVLLVGVMSAGAGLITGALFTNTESVAARTPSPPERSISQPRPQRR